MNGLLSGPTATIPVDAKVAAVRAPMNVGITAPPNTLFTRRRQRRGIRCRPRLWHQAKVVRNREVRYALHAAARWRRVSRSARFDDPIELHGRQHPNQNPATCAIGLKRERLTATGRERSGVQRVLELCRAAPDMLTTEDDGLSAPRAGTVLFYSNLRWCATLCLPLCSST
jgi:hypothetical protein